MHLYAILGVSTPKIVGVAYITTYVREHTTFHKDCNMMTGYRRKQSKEDYNIILCHREYPQWWMVGNKKLLGYPDHAGM